jgi:hypothetical protein
VYVLGNEGQKGHVAGLLDGEGQHMLVAVAGAGAAAGLDLAAV